MHVCMWVIEAAEDSEEDVSMVCMHVYVYVCVYMCVCVCMYSCVCVCNVCVYAAE